MTPTLNQEEDKENQVQNRPDGEDVPCDVCHGHKSSSVKSCLMCQASYCQPHLSTHLRDATLRKHRLTDPATFPSSHLCRKHRKPLTKFCREEQTPVCEECTEREHRRHRVVGMEKASAGVKVKRNLFISLVSSHFSHIFHWTLLFHRGRNQSVSPFLSVKNHVLLSSVVLVPALLILKCFLSGFCRLG